jgi:hypothetical protein
MPGGIYSRQVRGGNGRVPRMYYGSGIFSGQRFFTQTQDAYTPVAYGATRSAVPAPIPTVIPTSSMNRGGYGGSLIEEGAPARGGGGAWHPTGGPLLAASAMLVIGIIWLHYVHFQK